MGLAIGPGTVWDILADADVALVEWQGTVPQVEAHLDRLLRAMYEVAETPRTALASTSIGSSGPVSNRQPSEYARMRLGCVDRG